MPKTVTNGPLKLHLGCGTQIRPDWINLDARPAPGVDIVRDVLRGLPFADESVDEIYSENFIEHVPQSETIWLMNEMWRVLKPRGRAEHLVPEAGSIFDLADPTHVSRWHRETFTYFELGHGRNSYYREGNSNLIKPWIITIRITKPNELLCVEMLKP